jgi:hypothetical protein
MRIIPWYIIIAFTIVCSCRQPGLGYATIKPSLAPYETDSTYFPFDRLHPSELSPRPVRITREGDLLSIENTYNEGHSSIDLAIILNPQLKIVEAHYDSWNDMINGSDTYYRIEKVILEIDKNPFLDSIITGRYSLQIKNTVRTNKQLKRLGIKDTSFYSTFNGKFKIYRIDDIKTNMTPESIKK